MLIFENHSKEEGVRRRDMSKIEDTIMTSQYWANEAIEWQKEPSFEFRFEKMLKLTSKNRNKEVILTNDSPFNFSKVVVSLAKGEDKTLIYDFSVFGKKCEAFHSYNLKVPENTYKTLEKTFSDPYTQWTIDCEDALYKELEKAEKSNYKLCAVPPTFKVTAHVPEWVFNDSFSLWCWYWNEEEVAKGGTGAFVLNPCERVDSDVVTCYVPNDTTHVLFARGIRYTNTYAITWEWMNFNKSRDVDLKKEGTVIYLRDSEKEWISF